MVYMRKAKRILSLVLCLLMLAGMFPVSAAATDELMPPEVEICSHSGGEATCTTQAVCDTCGESYGELTSHSYVDGICSVCQSADPDYVAPCTHNGGTASCTAQAICETCGESYGEVLAHSYGEDHKCTLCSALDPTAAPEAKPACICGDKCTLNAVFSECAACVEDYTVCLGAEQTMTADELAELFRALPKASSITAETSQEEKDAIMAQLEIAVNAYYAMLESDPEEAALFEQNYAQLFLDAMELNDALTGNYSAQYAVIEYNANSRNNVTITVRNDEDEYITDATITVTMGDNSYEVVNLGNGRYAFTRDSTSRWDSYSIAVSAPGHDSQTLSIRGNSSSTTVTLEKLEDLSEENWQSFRVFYIATGTFPESYIGAGEPSDYGPSGNDTPLVVINIDINKLRREYYDVVLYQENTGGNYYHMIPVGPAKSMEAAVNFWNAVKACMDSASISAFEATGLYNDFVIYVLKKQGNGSQHADGILNVNVAPSVYAYVVELYSNGSYFHGFATDSTAGEFASIDDVRQAYNNHLGQNITWNGNTGVYLTADNAYTITLTQTIGASGAENQNGINYESRNADNTYYLAAFNSTVSEGAEGYNTVKYTDGVDHEYLFADETSVVASGSSVPAFSGDPSDKRPGYTFSGWILEGGDDRVLSNEDIAEMTVTENMVFHAEWVRIPTEFEATVNVLLNDNYPSDLFDMLGVSSADIYVSADGSTYYKLERTAVGVHKAEIPNGTYKTYYSLDNGNSYTKIDERVFVIANSEGGRKVKFNSVSYNLDGGSSEPAIPELNFHHAGTAVNVTTVVPRKAGYVFMGWKDESGTVYQSGEQLTDYILTPYTLTAQWTKAIDVNVTVIINHGNDDTERNDNVAFSLVELRSGTTIHTALSKALSDEEHSGYELSEDPANKRITYSPSSVTFADLPDANYTVNCFKAGYETSISKESLADGTQNITLTLNYAPDDFALSFDVKMDESAKENPELWPQAVRIKAVRWEENGWVVVPQHQNTSVLVPIGNDGTGSAQVNVPKHWPDLENEAADYRVIVTAYIMPDGTTVTAGHTTGAKYPSSNGIYEGRITIESGGRTPNYPEATDVPSAFYSTSIPGQDGTPTVTISVNSHSVTFKADTVVGGMVEGVAEHTVEKQIKIPDCTGFRMTEPGPGYVFEGWYRKDGSSSGDWGDKVTVGEALEESITVYAKWKAPITISGIVYVAGSFIDDSGNEVPLYEHDRVRSVTIVLRHQGLGGHVATFEVPVNYNGNLGSGAYIFNSIPDNGSSYYIESRTVNYSARFQNEPESLNQSTNFDSYTANDNAALLGETDPSVASVNAYLDFAPQSFKLEYQVDATAIASVFRPESAEIVVTSRGTSHLTDPSQWPVIAQMLDNGDTLALSNGLGSGSTLVWNSYPDGATLYEYGIKLERVSGLGEHSGSGLPYSVSYQDPAYHTASGQSKMLKATLIPNKYPINYVLGIDDTAVTGMENAPKEHTWSFETAINVKPVRSGYEFKGWYDNDKFEGEPVSKIDASVSEETTLYAKWLQVQDKVNLTVKIIHTTDDGSSGLTDNYEKTLEVQLTHALKGSSNPYEDVANHSRSYDQDYWHTVDGAATEIFEVPSIFTNLPSDYAYSLNVQLDSYYVTEKSVEEVADPDTGVTTYNVAVTLQFKPDLLYLTVNAKMAEGIAEELWPVSAEVKINAFDAAADTLQWQTISQHKNTTLTITLDNTGKGSVGYPVWQWFNEEDKTPYYYRMEVVALHLQDGRIISMSGSDNVLYSGGDYLATIETDSACMYPAAEKLSGAYGSESNGGYSQTGTVTAVISTDIWDDNTPDHMQAEIKFISADISKGSVIDNISQVFELDLEDGVYKKTVQPLAVTLRAEEGFEFSHWTNESGTEVDPFVNQQIHGGQTYIYTAHWKPVSDLSYTVNHFDLSGKSIAQPDTYGSMNFGDLVQSEAHKKAIAGFIFDHAEHESITIGMEDNVINLYYAEDRNNDDIADYKQALVEFKSAENGSVSGDNLKQIFNFTEDQGYKGNATPLEVTKSPDAGYRFSHWSDSNGNIADPFVSRVFEGGKTYVFTAHWTARTDYSYTVQYLNKLDNSPVAEEKSVANQTFGSTVSETAVPVDGYYLDGANAQTFTIDAENKVIVFYYNIRQDLSLTVKHLEYGTQLQLHPNTEVKELEFKSKPDLEVLRANIHGYSYHSTVPEEITIGTSENVVIIYYEKQSYNYTVEYYYDDVLDESLTVKASALYGSRIESYTYQPKAGYTLDYVEGLPLTIGAHEGLNLIHIHYSRDENNDKVPDKYQAVVTFKIVDGTWTSMASGNKDIVEYYTLWKYENGQLIETPQTLGEIPSGQANEGYTGQGTWTPNVQAGSPVTGDAVYTLSFAPEYIIAATVINGTATVNDKAFDYIEVARNENESTTISFEPNEGYVLDIVRADGADAVLSDNSYTFKHDANHHIYVVYEKDANDDKIPDKYQKRVTFRILHGTWGGTETEIVKYYTLQTDGKNDINGTALLDVPNSMSPDISYDKYSGEWDEAPPREVSGTDAVIYTFRYTQKQQITVIIEVIGGTSTPVHSSTVYDYDDSDHSIEFAPYEGYILDSAKIKIDDISEEGTWKDITWDDASANGISRYTHDHSVNQHIRVVYAKNSNNDELPDYKQAFIKFETADENMGELIGNLEQVINFENEPYNGSDTPEQVAANPAEGYEFSHWTNEANETVDPFASRVFEGGKTYTFTAHWTPRNDLSYTVNYLDENGNNIREPKEYCAQLYDTVIKAADEVIEIDDYVFISADKEQLKLSVNADENVINLTYGKDVWKDSPNGEDSETGGDDIPDSRQALIRFISSDESKGAVVGKYAVQVFTIESGSSKVITPAQVDTLAANGYQFSHWTETGKTGNIDDPYVPMTVTGGMVTEYVAHWTERQDMSYTVNHFDLSGNSITETDTYGDMTFGTVVSSKAHKKDIAGYVYDHAESESITIGTGSNIINLYYAEDKNNDEIADYRQFFVHFVSADTTMGAVSHHITQAFPLEKDINGSYVGSVTPLRAENENSTGVVVTANEGYVEDYWTRDGISTPVNPFATIEAVGGGSTTFIVHFAEDGDKSGYADKYEATVTFKVHQGFWNSNKDSADRTESFMLYMQNEDTGWTLIEPAVSLGDRIPDVTAAIPDADNGFAAPGHWGNKDLSTDDPTANTPVVDGAVYTYSFSDLIPYTVTVTVENGSFTVDGAAGTSPITIKFGDDLKLEFAPAQEDGKAYALESVSVDGKAAALEEDGSYSFEDIKANHSIHVVYSIDQWSDPEKDKDPETPGDGIADCFQIKVNYHASPEEFGSVSRECEVHTILDADGKPAKQGTVQLNGSEARAKAADSGGVYEFVNWTDSNTSPAPGDTINAISTEALLSQTLENVAGGSEYNYYANFRYKMKIAAVYFVEHYLWDEIQREYVLDEDANFMGRGYVGDEVTADVESYSGYAVNTEKSVLKGVITEPVPDTITNQPTNLLTLKIYYDVDKGGENGEIPDDIPDIFQKKVTFKVVNGRFGNGETERVVYLTLLDEQGNYSPTGTATLTAPSDMQPNSGYSRGKWDEVPPTEVSGTEPVTYTYRYRQSLPYWIPKTGDDSNIGAWLGAMGMSLAGILGSVVALKRKKKDSERSSTTS